MGFREDSRIDGTREITFLYRLMAGMATESFGIECARLAGLPEKILKVAADRSQSFQSTVQERVKQNRCALIPLLFRCCVWADMYFFFRTGRCARLVHRCLTAGDLEAVSAVRELQILAESMSTMDPTIEDYSRLEDYEGSN